MTTAEPTDYIAEAITRHWGERCATKDTDDFPDLDGNAGRCPCCAAWEQYDALVSGEGGYGTSLGSSAVGHLREMYPAAYEALGASGRWSLRNYVNSRAALATDQKGGATG